MTNYATLAQTKASLKAELTVGVVAEENRLLDYIRIVSRRVDALMDPLRKREVFAPWLATRKVRVTSDLVNTWDNTLRLIDPLLSITSTTLGDTVLTDVVGFPDATVTPFEALRRTTDCCVSWYGAETCLTGPLFATIVGIWGLHRDYTNAWQAVDTLAAAITTTSATTFTVADADGADSYGMTPRFSPGNLIKIDSEFMEVTAVNTSTNVITVRRGVNGTTAATHLIATPVSTFQVEEPIRHAVARQAGLLYARRGAYSSVEITGMTEIRYPVDLLAELRGALAGFAYGR